MEKKITTKEIAKMANVSVGTVDRVLHNRGQVSAKTKQKILDLLEKGNYQPNLFARNLALNRTFNIVSLMPGFKAHDYWEAPTIGFTQAINELKQFGLNHTQLNYQTTQPSSFEKLVKQVVDSRPDAVIIAPIFHSETTLLAKQLDEAGIPYVFIDSNLSDLSALSFVGQDSYQSGYLAAKLLDFGSAALSKYLIISILDKQENNLINGHRTAGFRAYFKEKGQHQSINNLELSVDALPGALSDVLRESPEELNIFVPNSKVYHLAKLLEVERQRRSIKLIGYDLIKANRDHMERGNIDFIIDQKAQVQGYKAIQILYQHLILKQEVKRAYFMPLDIITKENLKYCES